MVFNSLIFMGFLAVVLALFIRSTTAAGTRFYGLAILFLYGWWDSWSRSLLRFTSLFD
jgi:hypothetical protein